jgi:hypothetical protein
MVRNNEPTTTEVGQKKMATESSAKTKEQVAAKKNKDFENKVSKGMTQKPWLKRKNEEAATNPAVTQGKVLNDKIASKIRNDVTRVSTNPTPLAALNKAIVRMAPTV